MADYKNLAKKRSRPGWASNVYIGVDSEITTYGQINSAAGTALGDAHKVDTDHVFAVGKGFIEAYTTQEFAELSGEATGETDSKIMDWKLTVFIPGTDEELAETMDKLLNDNGIVLIKEAECDTGKVIQLGTHCSPCNFSPKYMSGTTKNGKKGWEVEVSYSGKQLFYTENISIRP